MSKRLLHCLRISTKRPCRGGTLLFIQVEIVVYSAYTEAVFEKLRYRIAETLTLVESSLRYSRRRVRRSVFAVRSLDLGAHVFESFSLIHHFHDVTRDADTNASSEAI